MSWLTHVLGLDDPSGKWQLFWSGFGSDLGEFATVGALVGIVRRYNCAVHGCWRIGRHSVTTSEGDQHIVCRHHHPYGAPTAKDVLR